MSNMGITVTQTQPKTPDAVEQGANLEISDSGGGFQQDLVENDDNIIDGGVIEGIFTGIKQSGFVRDSRVPEGFQDKGVFGREIFPDFPVDYENIPQIEPQEPIPDYLFDITATVQVFDGYERDINGHINIKKKKWRTISRGELDDMRETMTAPLLYRIWNIKNIKKLTGLALPTLNEYFIVYPAKEKLVVDPRLEQLEPGINAAVVEAGPDIPVFESQQSPAGSKPWDNLYL